MRERGLKQNWEYGKKIPESKSLPMRERGLKRIRIRGRVIRIRVAPHVGAWIETPCRTGTTRPDAVAPRVGAWIETQVVGELRFQRESLPVWERGLKLLILEVVYTLIPVAPHVGAWVETGSSASVCQYGRSLPMWERGLKPLGVVLCDLNAYRRSPCGSVD